jgi:hypothetical protein
VNRIILGEKIPHGDSGGVVTFFVIFIVSLELTECGHKNAALTEERVCKINFCVEALLLR